MRYLLLSFLLFLSAALAAQLPLNFNSSAIKLNVTRDESLVLATRAGEVGLARNLQGEWRRADPDKNENYSGPTLDQANFFNKDTGFVSGFIRGKDSEYNIIYHTTNGGADWKAVNFGQDGWVDDAVNLDNGEAWMSVSGSGIAYTADYGLTWKKLKNPEPKQRFSRIYFNTVRQGIIGSLWNLVAYTPDNCMTWTFLPTPLDQGKYIKTNKNSRPALDRVAIFGDFFLVKQEELVFYTRRDSINWVWLPEYEDFYTDAENSALFFKTNNGSYLRADQDLAPLHAFELITGNYDARCKNGSLFVVSKGKMARLDGRDQLLTASFKTAKDFAIEPETIGYDRTGTIGLRDNKIYRQEKFQGPWKYLFTFPFDTDKGELSFIEEGRLLYERPDSLYYLNLAGELKKQQSKSRMLQEFIDNGIRQLIFSQGSRGCFHNFSHQLIYTNRAGAFISEMEISPAGEKDVLPDNDQEIAATDVSEFVSKIPQLFDPTRMATIEDLGFTTAEYKQCRKDILAFQASVQSKENKETSFFFHRNNLDFNRLLALVDSIPSMDQGTLKPALMYLSNMWSTTTNWTELRLVNNRNEVLSIRSNYYEPNAFYFPWVVSLNGYRMVTTNMEINRFIRQVYPALLGEKGRVNVLHALVKSLY